MHDVRRPGPELREERGRLALVRVGANELCPRPVRGRSLSIVTAAPEYLRVAEPRIRRQLLGQSRLADARLPDDEQQPRPARLRIVERVPKRFRLGLPADENSGSETIQWVGTDDR